MSFLTLMINLLQLVILQFVKHLINIGRLTSNSSSMIIFIVFLSTFTEKSKCIVNKSNMVKKTSDIGQMNILSDLNLIFELK